jgi:SSS family transporter
VEQTLVLGTVIAAPSLVMSEVSGLTYELCVLIMLALTLLYTLIGGMRAVIWTDIVQMMVFLVVPLIVLAYVLASSAGDSDALWAAAVNHRKLRTFDFSISTTGGITFWAGFTSMLIWHVSNYGCNQTLIQRYMTARSHTESCRAMLMSGFGLVIIWGSLLGMGVVLFAYNELHPGVVAPDTPADRVFAAFAMKVLPSGLKGLFVAAAFAAGMSTLSSILNSMGTVTLLDVWKLYSRKPATEAVWIARARWLTMMWGVFSFGAALFVLKFGTVITAGIKLGSVIGGTLAGIYVLGIFLPRAVAPGVFLGAVLSLGTLTYVGLMTDIHWAWYCAIAMLVTVVLGGGLSMLFPRVAYAEELVYRSPRKTEDPAGDT